MSNSTVSLDDVRIFVAVAQAKSLSRASVQLSMPVSTLSRRIHTLEQQLGVILLHRTTRSLQLTELGQKYFHRCLKAIDEFFYAQQALQDDTKELVGTIRVTMPPAFGINFLAPLFKRFQHQYPKLKLDLDLSSQTIDLIENKLDLAIRFKAPIDDRLIARSIASIQRQLYVAPAFLQHHPSIKHPRDIKLKDALGLKQEAEWILTNLQQESYKLRPDSDFTTNDVLMLKRLCLLGCGVALLSPHLVVDEVLNAQVQPLLPEWQGEIFPVYLVTSSRQQPMRVRLLMDYLQTALAGKIIL